MFKIGITSPDRLRLTRFFNKRGGKRVLSDVNIVSGEGEQNITKEGALRAATVYIKGVRHSVPNPDLHFSFSQERMDEGRGVRGSTVLLYLLHTCSVIQCVESFFEVNGKDITDGFFLIYRFVDVG